MGSLRAETPVSIALTGQVTSVEEGRMEGVLISAKRTGSTITVTVVSDASGHFQFPSSKMPPGQYALRIRAVGYDLEGPGAIETIAHKTVTADLKLRKDRRSCGATFELGMAR